MFLSYIYVMKLDKNLTPVVIEGALAAPAVAEDTEALAEAVETAETAAEGQ